MRNATQHSWVRVVLAFVAVLLVAGPGLVLAVGPNDYRVTVSALIILNGVQSQTTVSPSPGGTATLTLFVRYADGTTETVAGNAQGVVFNAPVGTGPTPGSGSIAGATYTAGSPGQVLLSGEYTNGGGTVTASRRIRNVNNT